MRRFFLGISILLLTMFCGGFALADAVLMPSDQPQANAFLRFAAKSYQERYGRAPDSADQLNAEMQYIAGTSILMHKLASESPLWNVGDEVNPELITLYNSYLEEYLRSEASAGRWIPGGDSIDLSGFEREVADTTQKVLSGEGPISIGNALSKDYNPGVISDASRQKEASELEGFIQGRIGGVINTLFGLLAVLSLVPIVVGGIQLTVSQGGQYAEKGKKTLFWGVMGLIIGFSGVLVINVLLDLLIQS